MRGRTRQPGGVPRYSTPRAGMAAGPSTAPTSSTALLWCATCRTVRCRGVVSSREFVPRAAIAFVARTLYEEPYGAVPMRHELALDAMPRVAYGVRVNRAWHTMYGQPAARPWRPMTPRLPSSPSIIGLQQTQFRPDIRYRVVHPVWQARRGGGWGFDGDAGVLYGPPVESGVEGARLTQRSWQMAHKSQ